MNNAPVVNPPAAPELPGEDSQVQAPRMPTGELVAKLDSLLARAAKTATASVDAAALEAAAGTANLDELTREELSTLANHARTSFAALATFTGRQIGNALELKDGAFDWKDGDAVATAIKKALDDQAELAKKLHELVNKPEIVGDAFDSLCELAFQCDRRETEKREVQNRILDNELKRPTNPIKPMDNGFDIKKSETALAKEINQECRFQIHGLFIGDLFRHVYRTGWYK